MKINRFLREETEDNIMVAVCFTCAKRWNEIGILLKISKIGFYSLEWSSNAVDSKTTSNSNNSNQSHLQTWLEMLVEIQGTLLVGWENGGSWRSCWWHSEGAEMAAGSIVLCLSLIKNIIGITAKTIATNTGIFIKIWCVVRWFNFET